MRYADFLQSAQLASNVEDMLLWYLSCHEAQNHLCKKTLPPCKMVGSLTRFNLLETISLDRLHVSKLCPILLGGLHIASRYPIKIYEQTGPKKHEINAKSELIKGAQWANLINSMSSKVL